MTRRGARPRARALALALAQALLLGSGAWGVALAHGPLLSLAEGTPGTGDAAAPDEAVLVALDPRERDVLLQAVDRLQYAHRFAAAEALLTRRIELEPRDGGALLQRSQLRIALGEPRGALADCLRAATTLDALAASACQAQAEAALGRSAAARDLVEAALARDAGLHRAESKDGAETRSWAQGIAAELAAAAGDPAAAERWHRASLAQAGARHFPRIAYARFLLQQRRPREAFDLLATAGDGATAIDLRRQALQAMAAGTTRRSGPAAFFALGITHLLGGYDHLAFLALLLLGTTLARSAHGAAAVRGAAATARTASTLRDAAKVVTAFTLAHSITLALAIGGVLRVPAAPVEAAIAASIVATAALLLHAVRRNRPAAAGHWGLAFVFGLVHGLGFANVLAELLHGTTLAGSLLAFNLGLETAQLGLVLLALPALTWLARHPRLARPTTAALTAAIGLLGSGWLLQRLPWPAW